MRRGWRKKPSALFSLNGYSPTLTLINRRQISADDFDKEESGAVFLKEDSRKKVLNAWQERKKTVLVHPFLQEKTTLGLLIHIQALLLARHLRGDLDCYLPFIGK